MQPAVNVCFISGEEFTQGIHEAQSRIDLGGVPGGMKQAARATARKRALTAARFQASRGLVLKGIAGETDCAADADDDSASTGVVPPSTTKRKRSPRTIGDAGAVQGAKFEGAEDEEVECSLEDVGDGDQWPGVKDVLDRLCSV
jgi:hypothetical protein